MSEPMSEPVREQGQAGPFSTRTLYLLISVGVLSLLFGFALAIFGGDVRPQNAENNTFSHSALGHSALVGFLQAMGVPVVVSQHDSGTKAATALIVLLEPTVHDENRSEASEMVETAAGVLVVLPKWRGEQDPEHRDRVTSVSLVDPEQVTDALSLVDFFGSISRPKKLSPLRSREDLGALPTLAVPQLIRSGAIDPLISSDEGILFGKLQGREVWVLSDPDIFSNHGLDNGQNALLTAQILGMVREGRPLIIDETLHGFLRKPDMWQALFEMPFILVTVQGMLCVVLLIWGGTARFGNPLPLGPALAKGSDFLIWNTARLMRVGGHSSLALARYRRVTVAAVAKRLHAPPGLRQLEIYKWIDRIEKNRQVSRPLASISQEIDDLLAKKSADSSALLAAARNLYCWKEEILHGPATN